MCSNEFIISDRELKLVFPQSLSKASLTTLNGENWVGEEAMNKLLELTCNQYDTWTPHSIGCYQEKQKQHQVEKSKFRYVDFHFTVFWLVYLTKFVYFSVFNAKIS